MQLSPALGIFGGTFDPIHNGHIFPILAGAELTQIKRIALMPCYIPSHKNAATVSSAHRLKMVELVCQEHPRFYPDSRDINRGKPTYSLDSLRELRHENPTSPLCFFIGSDSLQGLMRWHKWQTLFSLCHFIVCHRVSDPPADIHTVANTELQSLLKQKQTYDPADLHTKLSGHIYLADTQPVTMSSSFLRKRLTQSQSIQRFVPVSVLNYIQQHKLYQAPLEI